MNVSDLPERIAAKIAVDLSGCWLWTGASNQFGYGRVSWLGVERYAHRLTFHLLADPEFPISIGHRHPGDKNLDHRCEVQSCVNPEHLEPVTHQENMLRWRYPERRHGDTSGGAWGAEYAAAVRRAEAS